MSKEVFDFLFLFGYRFFVVGDSGSYVGAHFVDFAAKLVVGEFFEFGTEVFDLFCDGFEGLAVACGLVTEYFFKYICE